jgi:CheY-like chemotaxis protein
MRKTALIVDDSKSARVFLRRVLEAHDLDVDTAVSAEDALDYLTNNRPDVIFMDHLMPGMDGFEAVSAIKRNPLTATIPIMMYTSQKGEVYVGQARALGAVGVLPKELGSVEVSKVLKSLHIIGGENQDQSIEQEPPTNESRGEFTPVETLNQDLRILIQDLFEQQQASINRNLLDNHKAFATRITDQIRPPLPQEPGELPLADEGASSAFMTATVVVLAGFTLFFAWLYWQNEQSLLDVQAQYVELQQSFESRRVSDAEALRRAFESQRVSDAEDSLQSIQQVGDYQQSLDAINSVTVSSLEWGANQSAEYRFGESPLGDDRLNIVEQLNDYLLAINFTGVVRIETHVANYCLSILETGGYVLATDLMAVDCDKIGVSPEEADVMGLDQSVAFANFIRLADDQSGRQIRYEIISLGNSDPLLGYPATIDGVAASAWNRIATANNRVVISVYPDNP